MAKTVSRKKWILMMLGALALLVIAFPARAGGWALVTLREWPANVHVGKPVTVVFAVRQHGMTPAPGYTPVVRAVQGATELEVEAAPLKSGWEYAAELLFPTPGVWEWSISYHGGRDYPQTMLRSLSVLTLRSIPTTTTSAPRVRIPSTCLSSRFLPR